jgi:integrase
MGYIYRKKRKLPDGTEEFYGSYQYKIYDNGRVIRGSTGKYTESDARREVKKLEGNLASDQPLPETRKMFGQLLDEVIRDYQDNGRKTANSTKQRIEKSIRPKLGHRKVKDIVTSTIRQYRNERLKVVKAGTVNRELNIISKAFSLADLPYKPKIEKLKENNVRTGFVSRAQLECIRQNIENHLQCLVLFWFLTAWRRSEAFNLMWKDIDFDGGWIVLEPGTTKNDLGRRFPMTSELRSLLEEQRRFVSALEWKFSKKITYVFVHEDGQQIKSIRRSWKSACQKAGLAHILIHDLRRSAIMTFSQKGIDQQTGMLLSGHKTANVYTRYNIPTVDVLREAARKLDSTGTISGTMEVLGENRSTVSTFKTSSSGG